MSSTDDDAPPHYREATRTLLRYAALMTIVALLSGVLFQESSKKLDWAEAGTGRRLVAILSLALVHGHVFMTGVLIPIAMAGALFLARKAGGAVLSPRPLRWLTRGYLPFVAVTMGLMLYKGYHVLLAVRHGARDLDAVDASYFGGLTWLRHGVYAVAHIGMAVSLGVFVIALWRSLRRA